MKRSRKRSRRRGALLIIVLSILVLFALIALTFVVVAGSFNRAAKAAVRVSITDDEGRQLVERAFMDLLRGSNGGGAVESLLEDLYGSGALVVSQFNAAALAGNEMQFTVDRVSGPAVIEVDDAYAGCLITHLGRANGASSPAAMTTARIRMSRQAGAGQIELFIEPLASDGAMQSFIAPADYQVGDRYLINSRPYSGLDSSGYNESYDAVDALNPFLPYVPANVTNASQIIPSFVDRALVDNGDGDGVPDTLYDGSNGIPQLVDNDRDGINDSAWINIGLPRKSTVDGRTYQPLVAFFCPDLDGRLHVNANGSSTHPASSPDLLGQGVGPADIQITSLPNWANIISARYGADTQPGSAGGDAETDYIFFRGPEPYNDTAAVNRLYASPIDLDGNGLIAIDATGQPTYTDMLADTVVDVPYEINLVQPNGRDAPFTAPELERILRWWDADAVSLAQRLKSVLGLDPATATAAQMRQLQRSLTTHSAYIPVPRVPGGFLRLALDEDRDGSIDNPVPLTRQQVADIFPREVVEGGKMDLNRPWDPTDVETYKRARHAYAKQLFCLMMFSMDRDAATDKLIYRIPITETLNDDQHYELTVRRIAQWAVNAVDFRDPDAVMTPFEYDMNPFDGWDPDADGVIADAEIATVTLTNPAGATKTVSHYLSTGTVRLVWGCEYPDLIMTESLALHDRRTKDTNADNNSDNAGEAPPPAGYHATERGQKRIHEDFDPAAADPASEPKGDKDLDQFRIPLGSLFLEFACMRNTSANDPIFPGELYSTAGQLDLDKLDAAGTHPVWRVAISVPHHGKADGNVASSTAAAAETRSALNPLTRRGTYPDTLSFQPEHMSLLPITAGDADQFKWLELERFVWFTSTAPSDVTAQENAANTFLAAAAGAEIDAGQQFVIGPRVSTPIGTVPTPSIAQGDQVDAANPIDLSAVTHFICQGTTTSDGAIVGVNISEPLLDNHYSPRPTKGRDQYDDDSAAVDTPGECPDVPFDGDPNAVPLRPLKSSDLVETGSQTNYKTAFLQRLADPTGTWHPVRNPYITIDWKPLDLTVYNGEDMVPNPWDVDTHGEFDPEDPAVDEVVAANVSGSSERGQTANSNKWQQVWTLTAWLANNGNFPFYPEQSLGTLNANLAGGFPWLVWANRPFVGHYDLMLVPFTSSGRLLHDFRFNGAPFPYGHLFDFAYDSATAAENSTYYRVLEVVEVPSRFAGAQRWATGVAYPAAPPAPPSTPAQEPNYKYSLQRDPGVINVNTIAGEDVYAGLMQGKYAAWADFESRRKGNSGAGDPVTGRFLNPVRGPWASLTSSNSQRTMLAGGPIDGSPVLGAVHATADVQHPYKYFERVLRLGNLASTQSNVFAVWVTIGYFEVNPANGAIVRELGNDTGDVVRHRGFYIVDRSIPVGFERGKNHNVERTVLLRRFIE